MVRIEPLPQDCLSLAAEWLSRPEINRWLTADWRERDVTDALVAMAVRNHRRNRLFLVRHDTQACGLVGLAELEVVDRTAMVWYLLGDARLSGKGVSSEAVRQLTKWATRNLGLASMYAWVMEDNVASMRVLQRAGFREAGRVRLAATSGERLVDRVYFDIIAPEVWGGASADLVGSEGARDQ
jgi:RimJ/RimL family protein N-acetyltransferase